MASPAPSGIWVPHFTPEGRPFWNHSGTKESVWSKPTELKTPVEREMEKTPWEEYETGGRKYWVHAQTKETTWDMPAELQEILARFVPQAAPQQQQQRSQLPTTPSFVPQQGSPMGLNSVSGALVAPGGFLPQRPSQSAPQQQNQPMPDFQSHDEAERAFINMLVAFGVTVTWTWERTMRETITEPMFKALKTLAERKSAFEKYVSETKLAEIQEKEKSLSVWRKDWTKALDRMGGGTDKPDGVKSWWTWDNVKEELERRMQPEVWQGPRNDQEKETLFTEYVKALQAKEASRSRELRTKNIEKVTGILKSLSLDLAGSVRWRDAQATISQTPEWTADPALQTIDPIDILAIFEEEVRKAEKEANDTRKRVAEERRRRERKARENFNLLLEELRADGQITFDSTWKSIYPLLDSDERFENLLGIPGSSPLDLFWDMIDVLEAAAEESQRVVERILEDRKGKVTEEMTSGEFEKLLEGDERLVDIDYAIIKACFEKLHTRAVRNAKEDKKRAEKKLRLQIDDLRYAFKKLDPPVDLESSYEDILPRIQDAPEFSIVEQEADRKTAFEKFVRRQKEKLKDREREREREDEEAAADKDRRRDKGGSSRYSDRDHERNRERDRDSGRSSKRDRGGGSDRKTRERSSLLEGDESMSRDGERDNEGRRSKRPRSEDRRDMSGDEREKTRDGDGDVDMKMTEKLAPGEVEEGEIE